MLPADVLSALRRRPFVPFRLHVADGAFYDVRHPEMLFLTASSAHIGVPADPPGGLPERAVLIAMGHISRLEELLAPASPGTGQQGA